ncbi:MAG: hypothetical protein AAFQ37_08560 [Bacteroidota bacterium]
MRSNLLLILIGSFCLLNFYCEDECFVVNEAQLEVVIDPVQSTYQLGDTIWINANFSSDFGGTTDFTISEFGGLALAYLFRPDTTTGVIFDASDAFQSIARMGELIENRPGIEEDFGVYWQYRCPEGNCAFKIGLIPEETGNYLVQVAGLGFDIIDPKLECIEQNAFSRTTLLLEDNNVNTFFVGTRFDVYNLLAPSVSPFVSIGLEQRDILLVSVE